MKDERALIQRLRELGLSEYAARAYLALLRLGATEARAVSRLAKVPIAKVYGTLDQLQERGLVVVVAPGPPKTFTPVPIADFLRRKRQRHLDEARALEQEEERLGAMFPIVGDARMDDRGAVFTLRGRDSVLDKLQVFLGDAQDVLLLASDRFAARHHLPGILARASARGVRVRALVRVDAETLPALESLAAPLELRAKPAMEDASGDVAIAVFDGARFVTIHFVPDDGSASGHDVGLVVEETAIVRAMRGTLETLWAAAEPFADARRRVAGWKEQGPAG